jgi:aminocarboxymuconate-semialdehyde decarboxylase
MKVIDTQAHWYPRPLFEAYVESDGFPGCRREGDSYAVEMLPGQWTSLPVHFVELELQLETMRAAGVDVVVSSSGSFGDVDALPVGQAKEVAIAVNEERAAAEARFEGFLGLASIPWQDAAAAVEVLDDAVSRLGLRGVLIHSNIVGRPVDSPDLRPVYERMSELGVSLFLHPGRTLLEPHVRDLGLEVILSYMFDSSLAALRLVLSGILDGLSLDVIHPHCGATLPYLAGRIDHAYAKPWALGRELDRPPSERLTDFYTDTMCQSPETLAYAKSFYGVEHLLYGSDYPYFQPAESLAFVRGCLEDSEAQAVLWANAAALLGLEDPS